MCNGSGTDAAPAPAAVDRTEHMRRIGQTGGLTTYAFPTQDSITLIAVTLMGGVFSFWGPIVAALLLKLLPEILKNFGLPPDLLTILFGLGVLQVMMTAPAGLAVQVPKDLANLSRLVRSRLAGAAAE